MSEIETPRAVSPVTAPAVDGLARVVPQDLTGMITLKGNLATKGFAKAVQDVTGLSVPAQGGAHVDGDRGCIWMAPDEVLLVLPYGDVEAALVKIGKALGKAHHLAANVSDARAVFRIEGPAGREVLARVTPADLRAASFGPGMARRSRIAQIAAAFWMESDTAIVLVCFRSVADYAYDLLSTAAQSPEETGIFG